MIVKPKYRGFICTTAHPTGCFNNVKEQMEYVQSQGAVEGPKRVLVIGSSTGYGLASRIAAAFGFGATTLGIYFDKPGSETKSGTAGWYNNKAFEELAHSAGLGAKSINGDAYSDQIKQQAIDYIKDMMPEGKVDLVIYSLASPKRMDPVTGQVYSSVIKPIGHVFTGKTVDFHSGVVSEVSIAPASSTEIIETVAVMGGADWLRWMEALNVAGVLADQVMTTAFSYIGPELTHAIYKEGTIGMAKLDLEQKCQSINDLLVSLKGQAFVSVNKALVTQASSAIPVVPLYISILYKIMKQNQSHEDCIRQIYRLYAQRLYTGGTVPVDGEGRIRMDDLEMKPEVQQQIEAAWNEINSDNIDELGDLSGYRQDFFKLFGFDRDDVDYDVDVALD